MHLGEGVRHAILALHRLEPLTQGGRQRDAAEGRGEVAQRALRELHARQPLHALGEVADGHLPRPLQDVRGVDGRRAEDDIPVLLDTRAVDLEGRLRPLLAPHRVAEPRHLPGGRLREDPPTHEALAVPLRLERPVLLPPQGRDDAGPRRGDRHRRLPRLAGDARVEGLGDPGHLHQAAAPTAVHRARLHVQVPGEHHGLALGALPLHRRPQRAEEAQLEGQPRAAGGVRHVDVEEHEGAVVRQQAAALLVQLPLSQGLAIRPHDGPRARVGGDAVQSLPLRAGALVAGPEALEAWHVGSYLGALGRDRLRAQLHLLHAEDVDVVALEKRGQAPLEALDVLHRLLPTRHIPTHDVDVSHRRGGEG
mmetsp:Transcript_118238/g.331138  ORF Transcript_118238/g.331138 Transcript_118238/m.331138 type:complete len:365 (+) Transcript_118238:675-1769(+)